MGNSGIEIIRTKERITLYTTKGKSSTHLLLQSVLYDDKSWENINTMETSYPKEYTQPLTCSSAPSTVFNPYAGGG